MLAYIGEQFTYPNEVNGISISVKKLGRATLSIWIKSGRDEDVKAAIKEDFQSILKIPQNFQIHWDLFNQTDEEKLEQREQAQKKPHKK